MSTSSPALLLPESPLPPAASPSRAPAADRPAWPPTQSLRLEHREDGALWAVREDGACWVRAVRCFPWSEPHHFISLRDADGDEVAFVEDASELPAGSRAALHAALVESGFILHIERVAAIDEEVEIRTWQVDTREGPRRFQTARDHWPRELPDGGLLIRDVAGDLYLIDDLDALDEPSRTTLWAFVG